MNHERLKRCVGDRGAMLVEAAFVFPLFITLLFGIIDIGMAEFQTSQATAAARDGARVGILNYLNADVSGSSDQQAIITQVNARLAGQAATITVSCINGLTGSTALDCSSAIPDQDRIRVTVSWSYSALTPVMASMGPKTISGTATMAVLGEPTSLPSTTTTASTASTTTTVVGSTTSTASTSSTTSTTWPPGSCAVSSLSVSPSLPLTRQNKNSTALKNDTTFTVTTNNAATCTALKIQLPTKTAPTTVSLTPGGGATWTLLVHKSDYAWAAGTNLPLYIQSSGGITLNGGTFAVTVT